MYISVVLYLLLWTITLVVGPDLYLIYTADVPQHGKTKIATFAYDTCIIAQHEYPELASIYLQKHLDVVQYRFELWRFTINNSKSVHITFTIRKSLCPSDL